ncbi:MAG: hypothetical protein ABI378_10635 [Chitinophagaceae bacterium]
MRQLFLFAFLFFSALSGKAQTPDDKALTKMVREQSYTFKPDFIVQMKLGNRNIAHPEQYYLRLTPDSIVCYLPTPRRRNKSDAIKNFNPKDKQAVDALFYERFALKGYHYKVLEATKNEWQIQLVPKIKGRIQQVRLNVLPGGHTTLTVGTTGYEPITYAGNIVANKKLKKHR